MLLAQIDRDHTQAAWTATLRQREVEAEAAAYGISVTEYLEAMDMSPSTPFRPRSALMDPIEADHLHAVQTANILALREEQSREEQKMNALRMLNQAAYYRSVGIKQVV